MTIRCTTRTCTHQQFVASFPWTIAEQEAYSHLKSIHRDVSVGLWNFIRLLARDGPIPVFTTCSHCCLTGTVHTITASPHESLLTIESLLWSLLESQLNSQLSCPLNSLLDTLLERAAFERAAPWEE